MSPERWQQVQDVFLAASEHLGDERKTYLDEACADDRELYDEVVSLLDASAGGESLIESAVQSVFQLALDEAGDSSRDGPDRFGPYQVIHKLGEGGLATVYLAERADEHFNMRVAIKVVKRGMDTVDILRRLRQERQILAHLDHPHIARLLDGGSSETGLPYFVMEHIEGEPIDEYCERRELSTSERLELFRRVCSAVHYAHQGLVIHRDIKPSNILVSADGLPKLLDFGIAKLLDSGESPGTLGRTAAGVQLLTPEYASPEQIRGEALTTATDVYSLGVLLYRLLTGEQPYSVTSARPEELRRVVCESEPSRPSSIAPGAMAGDLDNIVLMALAKEPQRRYASVEQLSDDIDRYLRSLPVRARKDTLAYRTGKFVRRHRGVVAAACLVLVALIGGMIATARQARIARQERTNALHHLDQARLQSTLAEQVSVFLVDLFEISDPGEARGNAVTAREILDAGSERIRRQLSEQPEVKTELMTTMGDVYRKLGLYDRALVLFDEALSERRELWGEESPEVARTRTRVADVRFEKGDYEVAERLLRQALETQRRLAGEPRNDLVDQAHLDVATTLDQLATVLDVRGQTDEAETFFHEALDLRQRLLGDDHLAVAKVRNNLGELYDHLGRWEDAESLFRQVLDLRLERLGEDHPDVSVSLHNLASVLDAQGRREEAEPLYRLVLELRRKLFGDESADVAMSLNNLAVTLQFLDRHHEAVPMFNQALAINRKVRGPESRLVFGTMSNLAMSLRALGDHEKAEEIFIEVLEQRRRVLGEKHPSVALSVYRLATFYSDIGRLTEAERFFEESLEIHREIFEPGDYRISFPLYFLVRLRCDRGDFQGAAPFLREVVEIRQRVYDQDHHDRVAAEELLKTCQAQELD